MRFPQSFGPLKTMYDNGVETACWNSMGDITDVMSQFINTNLQPIAEVIEESQLKLAKHLNIKESEMWDSTSYEHTGLVLR